MTTRVEEIIWLESEADRLKSERAEYLAKVESERAEYLAKVDPPIEEYQWEAARKIAEELDAGKSQRQLAKEIGKSQSHIKLMAKMAREYLSTQPEARPPFNMAYNSPEVRGPSAAKGTTHESLRDEPQLEDYSDGHIETPAEFESKRAESHLNSCGNVHDVFRTAVAVLNSSTADRIKHSVYFYRESIKTPLPNVTAAEIRKLSDTLSALADIWDE